jgi:hypothetical protein
MKLLPYFKELCKIEKSFVGCKIIGVNSNEKDGFNMTVQMHSDYTSFSIDFQMVDESFPKFKEVMRIISSIYDLTAEYAAGNDKMNAKQLLLDYVEDGQKGSEKLLEFDLKNMPEKEALRMARELLEKNGALVMAPEDLDNGEDTAEETKVLSMSKTG